MTDCKSILSPAVTARNGLKAKMEAWAYQLWEDEGRPSGRALAHWTRAQEAFSVRAVRPSPAVSAYLPDRSTCLLTKSINQPVRHIHWCNAR